MTRMGVERSGFISSLTWPLASETDDAVLVIPVGSTEQHGPHLPLTTDTDLAVALADRLAGSAVHVVVAPAVSYGSSGEHASFAGTLSIGNAATRLVLIELVRSASGTWGRVLLISTHGGNNTSVHQAITQLRSEGIDVQAWFPSWPGDAHAGYTETSLMLSLSPERVDTTAVRAGNCDPLPQIFNVLRSEGVRAISPNGVLGDPTAADADHGRRMLDAATDELVQLVTTWPGTKH